MNTKQLMSRLLTAACILIMTACHARLSMPPDGKEFLTKQKLKLNFPHSICSVLPLSETEGLCCYNDQDVDSVYFKHTYDGFRTIHDWSALKGRLAYLKRYYNTVYAMMWSGKLFCSYDSGLHWRNLPLPMCLCPSGFWISEKGVLCLSKFFQDPEQKKPDVIVSYDGGHTWKDTRQHPLSCSVISNGLLCSDVEGKLTYYDFISRQVSEIPGVNSGTYLKASEDVAAVGSNVCFYKFRDGRLKKISRLSYNGPFILYYIPNEIYKHGNVIYTCIDHFTTSDRVKHSAMSFFTLDKGKHWKRLGDETNGMLTPSMSWAGYGEKLYYIARDTLYIATPKH